ncbi:MAG: ABC transporter substrate-binding protein [Candidatus Dormibacteraeota bacterium]|jgi:ABC-type nitrate/sulfonate/bicarbonate transport system substrate-binding protein|nr:ABC transporter substrate-binding protein [Candidatus Dormibacteraeota bacterium]
MLTPTRRVLTWTSLLLGLAMAAGLAACGNAQPASSKAPTTIRLGWQPAAETAYLYAEAHNLFHKYGVNVEPLEFTSGPAELAAIASNSIDIAQLGAPPWISSVAQGSGLKIIMGLQNNTLDGLYVNPKSGITGLGTLAGHTIGDQLGSGPDGDLHQILKKLGISFSSVNIVNLTPPEMLPAYLNGDIQAAWTGAPYGNRLVAAGAKYLASTAPETYGFYQANFYAVSPQFLTAHPNAVARFVAAINAGGQAANKDPNSVLTQFAQLAGISQSVALAIMKAQPNDSIAQFLNPDFPLSFVTAGGFGSQLQGLGDILHQEGLITTVPPNLASFVDSAVMRAAAKVKPT